MALRTTLVHATDDGIVNNNRWPASMGINLLWQPAVNVVTIIMVYYFTLVTAK